MSTRWLALVLLMGCGAPSPAEPASPVTPTADVPPPESAVSAAEAPPPTTTGADGGLPSGAAVAAMSLEETTAGPVVMQTVSLAADETVELPPSADHEHLLLVLSGRVEIAPGKAPGALLGPWHALRARGVPVVVTALEEARLVKALVHGEALPKRDVEVIDLKTTEALTWAGGRAHARLGFEDGRASFGLLYADPELGVPRHTHPDSIEVIGLLSGEGTMGIGEGERTVSRGEAFHIPAGQSHDYRPAGTQRLFAVQLYLPPGPEQRFKSMGP